MTRKFICELKYIKISFGINMTRILELFYAPIDTLKSDELYYFENEKSKNREGELNVLMNFI